MKYGYDAEGRLAVARDARGNTTSRYVYDMAGRAVEYRKSALWNTDSGAEQVYIHNFYEDGTNRLVEQNVRAAGIGIDAVYSYGEASKGQMPDVIYGVELKHKIWQSAIEYEYDGLGRRVKETLVNGSVRKPVAYSYVPGSTLLEKIDNNGDEYRYEYDNVGQITAIYHNNELEESYGYDSHNRLVRVNDKKQNRTEIYSYDKGGNLVNRSVYQYTTGAVGAATQTAAYGYEDAVWKDLLTSYKGQSLSYDAIGNPLTYRDGMSSPLRCPSLSAADKPPCQSPTAAPTLTRCICHWQRS